MAVQVTHRFTVQGYHRMGETGVLRPGLRVELLGGKVNDICHPLALFKPGWYIGLLKLSYQF